MTTVLFIQEFGANLGHVSVLVAAAKALPPDVRRVFVVPQVAVAASTIRAAFGPDSEIVQSPPFNGPAVAKDKRIAERTLADVFSQLGYADEGALRHAVERWRGLLAALKPDLIVCDFAPTVRLAAGGRTPMIQVGTGFCTPPAGRRLVDLYDAQKPLTEWSTANEDRLVAAAQAVGAATGGPSIAVFADLFDGEAMVIPNAPTLDPYRAVRAVPTVGVFAPPVPCGPAPGQRKGPAIFCYLWSDHPNLDTIVTALNGIVVPTQLHLRGLDPHHVARQCAPHIGVRTGEADFARMLPQTRLFLHYGGLGSCYAGLLAGTVQVVVAYDLEKEINAIRLTEIGGARGLRLVPPVDIAALRKLIADALDDPALSSGALIAAGYHQNSKQPDGRFALGRAFEALVGRRPT